MQVICISRGTFSGGKELAERLAAKLGYNVLGREELVEAATSEGIQVGKLEIAMVKPWTFNDRLAVEREHYLAFTTAYLCDKAMEGKLVYHGRTGHLLLPGVSHVLRIRAVADKEYRIKAAMQRLGLPREKAIRYLDEVEGDIHRWVQSMYGSSWDDSNHYDVIVNLEQMSAENASSALVSVAQLPNFQMTPASKQAMEDLRLAAKARVLLAKDDRTAGLSFKARASKGAVTVTYQPQHSDIAEATPWPPPASFGYRRFSIINPRFSNMLSR
jgi:cytidylate kinase